VKGLVRAELLRLRKRRSLQVIVLAVPLLLGFFFAAGASSIYDPGPFDPVALRQQYIDQGLVIGLPPEEADRYLDEIIASEASNWDQMLESSALTRAGYVFPQSLVTLLGNGSFLFVALILLAATTIGDEFGWGTIRSTLLASSNRLRLLAVRLAALVLTTVLILAMLLILATVLPLLLNTASGRLPAQMPVFGGAAFVTLLVGQLVAGIAVIAFSALATVTVRSGALTLVVALVYVAVEAVILAGLLRFESFQTNGPNEWLLNLLPVRGIATILDVAGRAASGLTWYQGDVVSRDLSPIGAPLVALLAWAGLFGALAFRRFRRMDIVE
jgi:ABC-type transport system involved in multi-copper enzyme maturation permease subunit